MKKKEKKKHVIQTLNTYFQNFEAEDMKQSRKRSQPHTHAPQLAFCGRCRSNVCENVWLR